LPTSAASVQKNTLEVKVAIEDPPPMIRPEMLVTATFLAPPQAESPEEDSQDAERLLVPRQLVESSGSGHAVWIVDALGKARKRSVRLGKAASGELIEVAEGLAPTDKLITGGREGLQDGDRVAVHGEDSSIGLTAARS
jgi:multidrug efflux pump subunit AcrA (membrane-fusion protein)